jgi:hypothetical protein
MIMNQNFNINFKESTDDVEKSDDPHYVRHATTANVRNICFTWPNGRKKSFNYAYLQSFDYNHLDGVLILEFTSDTVRLSGIRLGLLNMELTFHTPLNVTCIDERYNSQLPSTDFIINNIELASERK